MKSAELYGSLGVSALPEGYAYGVLELARKDLSVKGRPQQFLQLAPR